MNNHVTIKVIDLIGSPLCISAEEGQRVFDKVLPSLKDGRSVTISFAHVKTVISLFLNVAIGQLYDSFSEDEIRSRIKVEGLSTQDMELLKRVVVNAKKYYSNPEGYDAAWLEEGDEDEE